MVFPRLYEQTISTWREGEILLVAGRVDHRGEEVSLLADLAVEWEAAEAAGSDAFGRQVAAGDRGSGRRPGGNGRGHGNGNGNGNGNGGPGAPGDPRAGSRPLVAVGPGPAAPVGAAVVGGASGAASGAAR